MDATQLESLRKHAVKAIVPRLPALDRADLVAMLAAESDAAVPREALTKALADEIAKRDADDEAAAKEAAAAAADDDSLPEGPPDWQAEDYTGPLSGEQAQWRNKHLTPGRLAAQDTKPAAEVSTK